MSIQQFFYPQIDVLYAKQYLVECGLQLPGGQRLSLVDPSRVDQRRFPCKKSVVPFVRGIQVFHDASQRVIGCADFHKQRFEFFTPVPEHVFRISLSERKAPFFVQVLGQDTVVQLRQLFSLNDFVRYHLGRDPVQFREARYRVYPDKEDEKDHDDIAEEYLLPYR